MILTLKMVGLAFEASIPRTVPTEEKDYERERTRAAAFIW
jgi:hypothetical protein